MNNNPAPITAEATLMGHSDGIAALTILPDGRLASAASDKTIKLWDVERGTCEVILEHSAAIRALTILPDGRLASGSSDQIIKLWDAESGRCVGELFKRTSTIRTVADIYLGALLGQLSNNISTLFPPAEFLALVSLDDGRLASGMNRNSIKLWDLKNNQYNAKLQGHSSSVLVLTVLPDGRLASGAQDSTIKLWDVKNEVCLATLQGHSDAVHALTTLADGRLASGAQDSTIKLWDVKNGVCLATLQGHSDAVHALTTLADGRLASGAQDSTIKLWDVKNGVCLATLQGHSDAVRALTVLPDGRLASGSSDNTIKLWRVSPAPAAVPALPMPTITATVTQPLSHLTLSLELPRQTVQYDKTNAKNLLGKGTFGAVYVGMWQGSTPVAVKELFVQSATDTLIAEFKNEMSIMASLRHPNIVQLYGVCTQTAPYCMVMEWMHQGSLLKLLGDKNHALPWNQREHMAQDISQGLAHLHAHHPHPIIHRDLKSLNVLIDKNFNAKLADFGLAKLRQESASSTNSGGSAGTVLWMAPELFKRGGKASTASDVYSLAVVLWELASRTIPFADADSPAIAVTWVQQGEREEIPSDTPAHIKVLITECWDGDPQKRPTAAQVVQRLKGSVSTAPATAPKPTPQYQGNLESAPAPRGHYQPNLNS